MSLLSRNRVEDASCFTRSLRTRACLTKIAGIAAHEMAGSGTQFQKWSRCIDPHTRSAFFAAGECVRLACASESPLHSPRFASGALREARSRRHAEPAAPADHTPYASR